MHCCMVMYHLCLAAAATAAVLLLLLVPHLGRALGAAEPLGCTHDEAWSTGPESWHQCSAWPQQLLPSGQQSW
jgi:hypothetical protein